jgi:RHH-type proline utilization regulon transcriptional repressor/proline dehydrogenase/delta 1-pyrroline-5-carboxylate dehydrogenase
MGPIIEPPGPKLLSGLTELGDGESWLLEPKQLDGSGRLWSPGIRGGVKPGSVFHQTEYFGPVLGLIRASSVAEAVAIQNGVSYGLTAGIHSLDPGEVQYWLGKVEAGNLYVNRGITGAIVRRQSFGGWKKSAVGPTTKAGGPNYLTAFGVFDGREAESGTLPDLPDDPNIRAIIEASLEGAGNAERLFMHRAAVSDERAWATHFGASVDESGLVVERNVLRYRPTEVTVRVSALTPGWQLARVVMAARRVGATVHLSVAATPPDSLRIALLGRPGDWALASVHVESELDFVKRVQKDPPARIRLLTGSAALLHVHFDGNPEVAIWGGPVTPSGRVEALPFVMEQAVSMTVHRFGTLDPRFVRLAESL